MILCREFKDFSAIYDSLEDIPNEFKFGNYEGTLSEDVWDKYIERMYISKGYNEEGSHVGTVSRAGRNWKSICQEHKCHYALASPTIVDDWCDKLLDNMTKYSARKNYLTYINHFYRYLKWNIEYPHIYNPVQFAVDRFETTEEIWTAYDSYFGGDSDD